MSASDVLCRLDALTAQECWRLSCVARIYADGTDWSGEDLLQEAFVAALDRRAWRADLSTRVFLTGVMRSLAFSRRKARRADTRGTDALSGSEPSEEIFETLAGSASDDPAVQVSENDASQALLTRLEDLFVEDQQVLRVIQGRAREESPEAIRNALGVTTSQYETVCRRLLRGYQKTIKGERHE